MAFQLDPFLAYLQPPPMASSQTPATRDEILARQDRLKKLGLDEGLLGKASDLSLALSDKRSGMQSQALKSLGSMASTL